MKILSLFTFLYLFTTTSIFAQNKTLILSNDLNAARPNELIIISRTEINKIFGTLKKAKEIAITDKNSKVLTVQFDDLDQDGSWDEAVFLYSFKPAEKAILNLKPANPVKKTVEVFAHVRQKRKNADDTFGVNLAADSIPAGQPNTDFSKTKLPPFLTEGPAWENDKVGFRLYFDIRNGKDIWGKTTSKMMMDTVGVNPALIYHNRASWGMDVYKVGSSLSAGALAINIKLKNGQDSLIRLGGKNMGPVHYQKIADGPVRAMFRMSYPQWNIAKGLSPVSITEEISIWRGQYYYQSNVKVKNAPPGAELVTGFANLFNINAEEYKSSKSAVYYSFGKQSENKDNLGLAILVHANDLLSLGKTSTNQKDIKDSYLVSLKLAPKTGSNTFRFYAAWEPTDSRFKEKTDFVNFLKEQTEFYEHSIKVKLF